MVKIGQQDVVDGTAQDAELVPPDPYADCPECCIVEDEGEDWFVPAEFRQDSATFEKQTVMVRFWELEGKRYCFPIGSKEKGILD